jgi:hypothetical protein
MATPKQKFVAKKMGKEVEEEDDDEKETYEMEKSEAISEHKRLVKLLRTGSKAELLKEALEQEKELNDKILKNNED